MHPGKMIGDISSLVALNAANKMPLNVCIGKLLLFGYRLLNKVFRKRFLSIFGELTYRFCGV